MPVTTAGKLNQLPPKLENGLKRGLILSGKLVAQRATGKAPRLTGRLKRSITESAPYAIGPGAWAVNVGTNVEYAAIHEFGGKTPAHLIRARRGKALAFDWPNAPAGLKPGKDGKYYFRFVNHPGSLITARPYLRPALEESKADIRRLIAKNVAAAVTG